MADIGFRALAWCAQTWFEQLYQKVSDDVWDTYTLAEQLGLIVPRAEWIVYSPLPDRIIRPYAGGGLLNRDAFCFPTLSVSVFMTKLMGVFENRRSLRERQMCAVGADLVVSLDLCAHSGKRLGKKWQVRLRPRLVGLTPTLNPGDKPYNLSPSTRVDLNLDPLVDCPHLPPQALVVNEENNLIGSYVTSGTSIAGMLDWLKVIAARSNFKARVCIVDNVPPSSNYSKYVRDLMEALRVEWVGQDRFHVCHNFSMHFNSSNPLFRDLIIIGWHNATTYRDARCEALVDCMLLAGTLTKQCTVNHVKLTVRPRTDDDQELIGSTGCVYRFGLSGEWQPVTEAVIAGWKLSDAYHKLFSSSPNVVVPEHVHSEDVLKMKVADYKRTSLDAMFEPAASTSAYREPKVIHPPPSPPAPTTHPPSYKG